ncbi:threonine/serine exporter ThrE family protein [Salinibacterium sp. NK8237]|uniref:threonine/serine ThrE exporter family protein n=1 Tax=Salinibacterium sp. NK8237 TaxID=2792038 RepID=UPI0018CD42A8|nr:threonine/serine exporter family protein [Salinibacterium sp. NK8237]MBH0131300.1 threonine/serine exporter family protein [Salinibacterium sp. NK8237]
MKIARRRLSLRVLVVAACSAAALALSAPAAATPAFPVSASTSTSTFTSTTAVSPALSINATPSGTAVAAVDDPDALDPGVPETPPATITPSPTSTLDPIPTPTSLSTSIPTPTPVPSETATPTPSATPTPAETPVDEVEIVPLPATPPSVATSTVSLTSLLIAIAVLAASLFVLWLALRRHSHPEHTAAPAAPLRDRNTSAGVVLDSMADVGEAMIDSGYPVSMVRSAVQDVATANGYPSAEVIVFPTAILVSLDADGSAQTRAVSAGRRSYLLYAIDVIDRVVKVGRVRAGSSAWVTRQLTKVRELSAPFSPVQRVFAYALTSAAISVLLGSSWLGVLLAAVLGLGVGTLLLLGERLPSAYTALVIVGAALGSSLIVLLVTRVSTDSGVLPSLVAPLVILLPGGLLTTAVIELATGHIMSGSARAAAGAMRLLLLAVGIVSAGALVGVPTINLDVSNDPLGPIAPWIAVAVFGIGISVYQCARPASIPWIMLVLYVAYGAQVIGDVLFGGVLSALVGAIAMTPVAVLVARHRSGPPAIVSFLPAFWLLVPGALGLVGVTEVLGGNTGAFSSLITTVGTMIAIALGVLIGLAASSSLRDQRIPQLFDFLDPAPATEPIAVPASGAQQETEASAEK